MLETLTGKDLIIITLLIMNGFLIWRSFGAIPESAFDLVQKLLEPAIRNSVTKHDDAIYDTSLRVLGRKPLTEAEYTAGSTPVDFSDETFGEDTVG